MVYIEIIFSCMFGGKYVLSGNIYANNGEITTKSKIDDETHLILLLTPSTPLIWNFGLMKFQD